MIRCAYRLLDLRELKRGNGPLAELTVVALSWRLGTGDEEGRLIDPAPEVSAGTTWTTASSPTRVATWAITTSQTIGVARHEQMVLARRHTT